MTRYNAWYNGSTTVTLTGNPDECPDVTEGPLSNSIGIGAMTVPGNSTLNRTQYDTNPFYFWMPWAENKNLSIHFQSSTDYYIDETQFWKLFASKSGDGYDITGFWIGTRPSTNSYYFRTTKCRDGGTHYPSAGSAGSGASWHWNITARVTPEYANWTFDFTEIDSNEVEWHTLIKFEGQAYTDGPRLVTTGDVPTTEGCLGCAINEQSDPESSSSTGEDSTSTDSSSSTSTGSGTGSSTRSSSSSSSTSGSSSYVSSTGVGSKHLANLCGTLALGTIAAFAVMLL